jgi:hypothetical protein
MSLPDLSEIWGSQVSIYRKLSGVHFLKVGVGESIVNATRITDHGSAV